MMDDASKFSTSDAFKRTVVGKHLRIGSEILFRRHAPVTEQSLECGDKTHLSISPVHLVFADTFIGHKNTVVTQAAIDAMQAFFKVDNMMQHILAAYQIVCILRKLQKVKVLYAGFYLIAQSKLLSILL